MKKLNFLLFIALPMLSKGQTTSENYVKTLTYRDSTTATTVFAEVTYIDGLGRPIQKVAGKMSASGKDIITAIEYDAFGRQLRDYLPYPSSASDLSVDASAIGNTIQYYNTSAFNNTQNPYNEKFMEPSPLGRPLKQSAPGTVWQGNVTDNNDHTVKFAYLTNITNEVQKVYAMATWSSANGSYSESLFTSGYYDPAKLEKTITQDENKTGTIYTGTDKASKNNTVEEFKDSEGKVVLKRTYNAGIAYDTYYAYDQYGNLAFVLPPKAEGVYVADLCYQYKYDSRKRVVEKKLPGKQWEFIVYDALDRTIATGPAISPFGGATTSNVGWLYTYYDALGRAAYSGWYPTTVTSATRYSLQSSNTGVPYTAVRGTGTVDGITMGYTAPSPAISGFKLLTVNYYDDYTWTGAASIPSSVELQNVASKVKGLSTGTWARVLDIASGITSEVTTTFYDRKGRAVRTYSTNYLGGYTQTDTKLDFDGTKNYTITKHKRLSGSTELTLRNDFNYTAQDRLQDVYHKINTSATQRLATNVYNETGLLVSKLVGGTSAINSQFQTIDYKYNIRGWLTDINDYTNLGNDFFAFHIAYNDVASSVDTGLPIPALYNGNISETWWRSASDNNLRKYSYKYDNLNRLNIAYYQRPNDAVKLTNSYNEAINYDKNGNITSLQRKGGLDDYTSPIVIDDLAYTYTAGTNKLTKVVDSSNSTQGFKDSATNTVDDYGYDDNGNLNKDNNKGIATITYNHMNLPVVISFGGSNSITYLYNATGTKLKKTVVEVQNGTPVTMEVDYLTGFQYKAGLIQLFPTAEGYIDCTKVGTSTTYSYVYQYKDHLGNVRMNFAYRPQLGQIPATIAIKDESHYYPFGLRHMNYNMDYLEYQEIDGTLALYPPITATGKLAYNFKFQGQEHQEEVGLNWDSFKYRNYMPDIGRFFNIDPLTEKYNTWSPYTFSGNRILDARELEGLEPKLLYNNLKEAAINFHTQYNGYSIEKDREIGTQYYKTDTPEGKRYSYTTPVLGEQGMVDPRLAADFPENTTMVGDDHTHGKDRNLNTLTTFDKTFKNPKKQGVTLQNINNFSVSGDNAPSQDDLAWTAQTAADPKVDFEASFVTTPSGLVWILTKDSDGNIKAQINKGQSAVNPSDSESTLQINNVSHVSPVIKPIESGDVDKKQ